MNDEKQFPEIPLEDDPSPDTALPLANEPEGDTNFTDHALEDMPTAEVHPEAAAVAISVEIDDTATEAGSEEVLPPKKPVVIADEEVAFTADKPPISAADTPFGKTDDGYAFKLPQPKFVKRANQDASEKLDEAFEDTNETFQMVAGQVDKLEAEVEWTDQAIRARDWRLEADLTPEKKQTSAPPPSILDKKEAEKRALAEQYKKMEEERRQRDNVHIEKMRADREALEARMRADRESRQTKVQSEMEATQERLRAEREAKRLEREAYEAQRRGITPPPPPATTKPNVPPPAQSVEPAKPETPEDKEQRALRNLSKPEPDTGENKPE
jgi:hypothetical protein